MSVPQVVVALDALGQLVVELPGPMATRRKVVMRRGEVETTLVRILEHQMVGEIEIGTDGAPTQQQVTHWERHQVWPQASCRFCLAEGRITAAAPRNKQRVERRADGVEIRRFAPKVSGLPKAPKAPKAKRAKIVVQTKTKKTAEELGL